MAGYASFRRAVAHGGHRPRAHVPRVRQAHRRCGRELPAHRHQELPPVRQPSLLQPSPRAGKYIRRIYVYLLYYTPYDI